VGYTFNPFTQTLDRKGSGSTVDFNGETVGASKRLEIVKVANEDLLIGDIVKMDNNLSCSKSGVDTRGNASVVGVCVTSANSGSTVTIQIMGIFENSVYASIPYGKAIYQTNDGKLTVNATSIVGEFYTRVGKSYGNGVILIKPEEPVEVA
jgi:hypothetical protein